MELVLLYSVCNLHLTFMYRMIQRCPPWKIRLNRIRQYDPPYCATVKGVKYIFGTLMLFIGMPLSFLESKIMVLWYLIYWFFTIWWFKYFSLCDFKRCVYISAFKTAFLLLGMTIIFDSNKLLDYTLTPYLWWSVYCLYIARFTQFLYLYTQLYSLYIQFYSHYIQI